VNDDRQRDEQEETELERLVTGHGQQAGKQEQGEKGVFHQCCPHPFPDQRGKDEHVDRQEHEQGCQAPFFTPEMHDLFEHRIFFTLITPKVDRPKAED
jgi:hypothetical protein